MMPLAIEVILGEVMATSVTMVLELLLTIIIAEGEMMALTWIEPLLVQLLLIGMAPPKEPPEAKEYLTGVTRRGRLVRWNGLWVGKLDDARPTCGGHNIRQQRDEQEQGKDDDQVPRTRTQEGNPLQQENGQDHEAIVGDLHVSGELPGNDGL
jgi:hypothetical protein